MRALSMAAVVVALALAGCGSSSSSSSNSTGASTAAGTVTTAAAATLPTAKFVLHAGLAFGVFHRYIYRPLHEGAFSGGLLHHKLAVLKATAAAVFVVHELKLAAADAKASPTLSRLLPQISALGTGFTAALAKLKSGHFNLLEIEAANNAIGSIKSGAGALGANVAESAPSLP